MSESMMPGLLLIGARIVHFASTLQVAGIFIFLLLVAPSARERLREHAPAAFDELRSRLLGMARLSLAISIVSAAAWLLFLATSITDAGVTRAISDGTVLMLLTSTQFGHDWAIRLSLGVLLAVLLSRADRQRQLRSLEFCVAVVFAVALLGTLAWAGHGGATPGLLGHVHATLDVLHLVAAGAWLGGLLPLRVLLVSAGRLSGSLGAMAAYNAARRFSVLGMVAVATLTITGLFNAWVLVGSLQAMVDSVYGVLLLVKIAIFLAMLAVAAFNRNKLTRAAPLAHGLQAMTQPLRQLKRNCLVEIALGLAIIVDVSVLGTIYHGMHS